MRARWFVRELERVNRAHEQQVATLVATIAHLAGNPLPTMSEPPVDVEAELEPALARYTLYPEEP